MSRKTWTEEETQILFEARAAGMSRRQIAAKLGRSEPSIKRHLANLNLSLLAHQPFQGQIIAHLTEAERGYLAGILDGEGSIGMYQHVYRRGDKLRVQYVVSVHIANTNQDLIEWLAAKIPRSHVRWDIRKDRQNRRPCGQWTLSTNPAIALLRELEPYLIAKRRIATLLKDGYRHLNAERRHQLWIDAHNHHFVPKSRVNHGSQQKIRGVADNAYRPSSEVSPDS